jgi:hypothetical protein
MRLQRRAGQCAESEPSLRLALCSACPARGADQGKSAVATGAVGLHCAETISTQTETRMASAIQDLEHFVQAALTQGASKADIEKALLEAGWPREQIRGALGLFADVAFPVPIPRPRPYLSAREAFSYLLLFTTLYLSAYYFGCLLFEFVDLRYLDPAAVEYHWRSPTDIIRWSASSVAVAFPVFLLLSRAIHRELARSPIKRLSAIRRWLTYLTLFVTAGFLIGDLTTLVYNALGGELTIRFVLKVLIVATIAGTIFGYYLWDLRAEEREA